jgi:hypothetical protein
MRIVEMDQKRLNLMLSQSDAQIGLYAYPVSRQNSNHINWSALLSLLGRLILRSFFKMIWTVLIHLKPHDL